MNEFQPNSDRDLESLTKERQPGIVIEFWQFLRYNKKWWLAPLLLSLLIIGVLSFFAAGPAAPFIYTLF